MTLARAAAKSAGARMRRLGALPVAANWAQRAALCESCPLRVIQRGISYCGTPFLQRVDRDPAFDGCGCPCHDKAKSPQEHCPLDFDHRPARKPAGRCDCKWCALEADGDRG